MTKPFYGPMNTLPAAALLAVTLQAVTFQAGAVQAAAVQAAAVLALLTPLAAHAQDAWPSTPVKVIVPSSPGGGTDAYARIIAQAAMGVRLRAVPAAKMATVTSVNNCLRMEIRNFIFAFLDHKSIR